MSLADVVRDAVKAEAKDKHPQDEGFLSHIGTQDKPIREQKDLVNSLSPQNPQSSTRFDDESHPGSSVKSNHVQKDSVSSGSTSPRRTRRHTSPPPNGHYQSRYGDDSNHTEPPVKSSHTQKDSAGPSSISVRKRPQSLNKSPIPGTPSARTGPPGSFAYNYSVPSSRHSSRANFRIEEGDTGQHNVQGRILEEESYFSPRMQSEFKSALEYNDPEQREREKELVEKRERERRRDEKWNPAKWFQESPKEERSSFDFAKKKEEPKGDGREQQGGVEEKDRPSDSLNRHKQNFLRSQSLPHINSETGRRSSAPTWRRLRSLLPAIASHTPAAAPEASVAVSNNLNITDELMSGGLATLMLRLWFERDEKDHRRIPVLLHRLRIRITDSLHPLHGHKAVFRIECEYANGAARWVVYRQLRDFVSLHTHYAFSNAYNRNAESLPDFPRTSLPYFKFLRTEGRHVGRADFALMQREALENYLIGLIRAVMFHPTSNRLSGFLEISALSIALAQSGGFQYKGGYLRLEPSGSRAGGFGRKGANWHERKEQKWCAVRESYLVVMKEPGELDVWDVFLFDSDFRIERPRRYYRRGLSLFHPVTEHDDLYFGGTKGNAQAEHDNQGDQSSMFGTVKSRISKVLHLGRHHHSSDADGKGRARSASDPNGTRRLSGSASSSGSDSDSASSRFGTPMLDPSTNTNPLIGDDTHDENGPDSRPPTDSKEAERRKKKHANEVSKHTFYIENSQMRLKLLPRNERQMLQWVTALEKAAATSHYTGNNRFGSFAPIRLNVAAQWLVDGRDYFWNLSRAILLARESIYIHDWWLSPELQMRRPHMEKYRLDRLLLRKAKEGVKIHVILYQEVSNRTTPTDSNYAKQTLTGLHENIMVQRSPSHFQTGTFYWAHHEKLCVIDEAIAFMGGLDLCFGRWDTPQHVLVDDSEFQSGPEIWPGKDYSNARISDFHTLNKPFEDMYDRTKVPRTPWHDVGLQVVGQPARDLARHFVQRLNHTRIMPFLLPPPDFKPGELTQMGLTGTLEMQICRSAGPWSMGTPSRIERSIQNAYLKAIQLSEHFVYIENQFFITSTTINDVKVENKIGDALVYRIIRAHSEGTPWKCCIMVPLLPGFPFPVDHSDASAVRIILECQNRTMCRGPDSIFARLRKEGINPDDYISFFALRNWAKLRGDVLTTEMVYIHGKVCIVDDRLAIIGSANINERSQRGDRDSEIATVIRDTDLIDGTMAGKPFKVGRFAHTLRVRLMREHVGVDVDAMDEDNLMDSEPVKEEYQQEEWDPESEQEHGQEKIFTHLKKPVHGSLIHDTIDEIEQAIHGTEDAYSKDAARGLRKVGIKTNGLDATAGDQQLEAERTTFSRDGQQEPGFTSSTVPTLEEKTIIENRPPKDQADVPPIKEDLDQQADGAGDGDAQRKENGVPPEARVNGELYGAPANASHSAEKDDGPPEPTSQKNDADHEEQEAPGVRTILREHLTAQLGTKWTLPTPRPVVDPDGFEDPIEDGFWKNVWVASAVHNTEIYRKVFHAIPDDLVTTWKQYKEFIMHHERLNKPAKDTSKPYPVARVPSESNDADALNPGDHPPSETTNTNESTGEGLYPIREGDRDGSENQASSSVSGSGSNLNSNSNNPNANSSSQGDKDKDTKGRKPARGDEPFEKWEREEMEKLLGELNGHLVVYTTRFLEGEDIANNFLFNSDRILPMPIYD